MELVLQASELRKVSRRDYLGKRRAEKVVELRDDLEDEEFLFSDSKYVCVFWYTTVVYGSTVYTVSCFPQANQG